MKLNTKSLKDVEIGVPVIADGVYFAKRMKVEVKPNKAGTGNNLVVQLKLLNETLMSRAGEPLTNRGQFVFTTWIGLVASENYDPNQRIKELALASGKGKDDEDFSVDDIAEFFKVKIGYQEASGQYQASNTVARFYAIKPEDKFTPPDFA
jgi:hypothetical protein